MRIEVPMKNYKKNDLNKNQEIISFDKKLIENINKSTNNDKNIENKYENFTI